MKWRVAVLCVVLGLGVLAVGTPSVVAAEANATATVSYDVTLPEPGEDEITLRIEVDNPPSGGLEFELPGRGFSVDETAGADVEAVFTHATITTEPTADRAEVTITYDPSEWLIRPSLDDYTATAEWALFRVFLDAPDDVVVEESVVGAGVRGEEFLFVGEHERYVRTVGDQRLTLVVPAAADPVDDPDEIADRLAESAAYLRVDAREERVLAVVAPPELRKGGLVAQDSAEFWASESLGLNWNTWTHEYVHLSQDWRPRRSTQWVIEAEARYYQHLLAYKFGTLEHEPTRTDGFDAFQAQLAEYTDHEGVRLQDPGSWQRNSNYEKGSLVIAALDAEIRDRTDGEADYRDVMRELNRESSNTMNGYRAALETVVGEPMDDFVDAYIAGTDTPDVPDDPARYQTDELDHDVAYAVETTIRTEADAGAETRGRAVFRGEDVTVTVEITNVGTDAALYPTFSVDTPGWTRSNETVRGATIDVDEHVTASAVELAPGETVVIAFDLAIPELVAFTEEIRTSVADTDGRDGTEVDYVSPVRRIEPNLVADAPTHHPNTTVTLDASGSEIPREPAQYEWDLSGDGEIDTVTDEPILETEFEPGTRDVSVRIRAANNITATTTARVNTTDVPVLGLPDRIEVNASEMVSISPNITNEYGLVRTEWDLGDNITTRGALHGWLSPGVYDVEVVAEDQFGAKNSTTLEIVSRDTPGAIVRLPPAIPADRKVPLRAVVQNQLGETVVRWEFSDGTTVTGANERVDLPPGEYDVTVRVRDEFGMESTVQRSIVVSDVPSVEIEGPRSVGVNETVTLVADVTNEFGAVTLEWQLGEETVTTTDRHVVEWTVPEGEHRVVVTAVDEHGATTTVTHDLSDDDTIPGFGLLPALLGVLLGWRLLVGAPRRRGHDL